MNKSNNLLKIQIFQLIDIMNLVILMLKFLEKFLIIIKTKKFVKKIYRKVLEIICK